MSAKIFNIEIPKMDYQIISLSIKDGEELVPLLESDLLFMTVREYSFSDKIEFQKSLGNGIQYNDITKKYDIVITSEDTKNMEIDKEYGYDVTILFDGNKPKQKLVGYFKLTDKYTYSKWGELNGNR